MAAALLGTNCAGGASGASQTGEEGKFGVATSVDDASSGAGACQTGGASGLVEAAAPDPDASWSSIKYAPRSWFLRFLFAE